MSVPKTIGRYEIIEEIGHGAMGRIYLAHDPMIDRRVAIKIIHAFDNLSAGEAEEMRQRFAREAQAAGKLQHPGVVTIYDVGEHAGSCFIAMEYIQGETFEPYTRAERLLPVGDVVGLISQACQALDYAHENQVVHRDIKPANLMLLHNGRVKITDFGLAKNPSANLTQEGVLIGTPNYMSPEQVMGRPLDGRSDLFSLTAVTYEMLTGLKPFAGDSVTTIIYRILNEYPKQPQFVNEAVPPELGAVLMRGLEKDPSRRYQTGHQLAAALQKHAAAAINASVAMAATMPVPIIRPGVVVPAAGEGASPANKPRRAPSRVEPPRPAPVPEAAPQVAPEPGHAERLPVARPVARERTGGSRFRTAFIFLGLATLVLVFPVTGNKSDGWGKAAGDGVPPFYRTASIVAAAPGGAPGASGGAPANGGAGSGSAGLPPIAVPGGVRTVTRTISSDPPGARIYVDDVEVAGGMFTVPADDDEIHTVVAESDCFIEKKDVRFDEDRPVVIEMKTPKVGQVPVSSDPAGAAIAIDGKPSGFVTPATLTLDACGAHQVVFTLDGYKKVESPLSGSDDSLSVNLPPIPKGFVKIAASYPIEVYEKGRKIGAGGKSIQLTSGKHELTLRNLDLFVEKKVTVNVPDGKTVTPEAALPGVGTLTILTSPGNCRIYVNDREIGAPPINDYPVAAGTYKVRAVYVPTGASKDATVTVTTGGTARVPFKFTP